MPHRPPKPKGRAMNTSRKGKIPKAYQPTTIGNLRRRNANPSRKPKE